MFFVLVSVFFFFNDTATTEIYTLSLHDALPICCRSRPGRNHPPRSPAGRGSARSEEHTSELRHQIISYAVFCLKKKKTASRPREDDVERMAVIARSWDESRA